MFKLERKIFSGLGILLVLVSLFFPVTVLADQKVAPAPYKKIVISLSQERLVAYSDFAVVLQTYVTTGGPGTPTPVGTYRVIAKMQNFTMRSPWPPSDWRWYPNSFVRYGLLYQSGGYFIHDAGWRNNFGPGSNTVLGTPGGDYTGTHGCVNVPVGAEATLFAWASVGTPVIVQP